MLGFKKLWYIAQGRHSTWSSDNRNKIQNNIRNFIKFLIAVWPSCIYGFEPLNHDSEIIYINIVNGRNFDTFKMEHLSQNFNAKHDKIMYYEVIRKEIVDSNCNILRESSVNFALESAENSAGMIETLLRKYEHDSFYVEWNLITQSNFKKYAIDNESFVSVLVLLKDVKQDDSSYISKHGKLCDKSLVEVQIRHGLRNGIQKIYYPNGKLFKVVEVVNNQKNGLESYFLPSGIIYEINLYKNNVIISKIYTFD